MTSAGSRVRWAWLETADGERLRARYLRGGDVAVVVSHGFTGSLDKPAVLAVADWLSAWASVITVDLRGHGRSTGHSTLGDDEVLDLDAAVGWARTLGHERVVSLGFSMSSAVVLRHAALVATTAEHRPTHRVDAVVAVSGPGRWFYAGTPPMRKVHRVATTRTGRYLAARVARTRISDRTWRHPMPLSPTGSAALLDVPLLVVHGDADPYFPVEHARWIVEAAGAPATLWEEPGMGHAESGTSRPLVDRIGAALPDLLAGRSPRPGGTDDRKEPAWPS